MAARIIIGREANNAPRWYLADNGQPWVGDYETALKIRWGLVAQGIGVFEIDLDANAERWAWSPALEPWAGVTDTDKAVN